MSSQLASEHVCHVHCNFCNTILAVNVPGNNLLNIVTVRCGHCANLRSVNMGTLLQAFPLQDFQKLQNHQIASQDSGGDCGPSSKCNRTSLMFPQEHDNQKILPIPPPEKRQRVPSAYNRFIKEEIQRIKANNPEISHREAFSAAAKNWAHFPHIHFGLTLNGKNQEKFDETIATHGGGQNSQGLY